MLRRWLDPIRSRRFYQKKFSTLPPLSHKGLTIYLRFDDAYSYLSVQTLRQLTRILSPEIAPFELVLSDVCPDDPELNKDAHQRYMMNDASVLALQHHFIFQLDAVKPTPELVAQAKVILQHTALVGDEYLHLLEQVFHMLWQGQTNKLNALYQRALISASHSKHKKTHLASSQTDNTQPHLLKPEFVVISSDVPVKYATIRLGETNYHAIDDLLRLTRRLKHEHLLTAEPVFLTNHVEWGEHLVSDPVVLNDIQALHAELHIYAPLEDPMTWLILSYLNREMAGYYNLTLRLHPISYHQKDRFDWLLASRLSKRAQVPFAPFCRPTEKTTLVLAQFFLAVARQHGHEESVDVYLSVLNDIWTKGVDILKPQVMARLMTHYQLTALATEVDAIRWLNQHDTEREALELPDLPAMKLLVKGQTHCFCSLYRVWQVETLLVKTVI